MDKLPKIKQETGAKKPNQSSNLVSTLEFKKSIKKRLPKDSPLRIILDGEKDHITREEFLIKMPIWMKLAKLET